MTFVFQSHNQKTSYQFVPSPLGLLLMDEGLVRGGAKSICRCFITLHDTSWHSGADANAPAEDFDGCG